MVLRLWVFARANDAVWQLGARNDANNVIVAYVVVVRRPAPWVPVALALVDWFRLALARADLGDFVLVNGHSRTVVVKYEGACANAGFAGYFR